MTIRDAHLDHLYVAAALPLLCESLTQSQQQRRAPDVPGGHLARTLLRVAGPRYRRRLSRWTECEPQRSNGTSPGSGGVGRPSRRSLAHHQLHPDRQTGGTVRPGLPRVIAQRSERSRPTRRAPSAQRCHAAPLTGGGDRGQHTAILRTLHEKPFMLPPAVQISRRGTSLRETEFRFDSPVSFNSAGTDGLCDGSATAFHIRTAVTLLPNPRKRKPEPYRHGSRHHDSFAPQCQTAR